MSTNSSISIAVVTGGPTMEVEGTTASTEAVVAYLETSNFRPVVVDLARLDEAVSQLSDCDVVFNAVHGRGGEDGGVHYLAALAGNVPVTGPAWWVHSLGADKIGFKAWASQYVRVPRNHDEPGEVSHRLIRKPRFGGGSIGLELLTVDQVGVVGADTVVEEFIAGRIVTCCIYPRLARRMPLLTIEPNGPVVYDEAAKRGRSDVAYRPIPITAGWTERVWTGSARLYGLLGGCGPIRFDWIVEDTTGEPVLLEVNTNPGWRPKGNMGLIVSAAGLTYRALVESVIAEAFDPQPISEQE